MTMMKTDYVEKVENVIEEMNNLKDFCLLKMVPEFENMDSSDIELMQRLFKLMKLSNDIMLEQAVILDYQKNKIDEILKIVKTLKND